MALTVTDLLHLTLFFAASFITYQWLCSALCTALMIGRNQNVTLTNTRPQQQVASIRFVVTIEKLTFILDRLGKIDNCIVYCCQLLVTGLNNVFPYVVSNIAVQCFILLSFITRQDNEIEYILLERFVFFFFKSSICRICVIFTKVYIVFYTLKCSMTRTP